MVKKIGCAWTTLIVLVTIEAVYATVFTVLWNLVIASPLFHVGLLSVFVVMLMLTAFAYVVQEIAIALTPCGNMLPFDEKDM